jgi:Ubiquitin-like domain
MVKLRYGDCHWAAQMSIFDVKLKLQTHCGTLVDDMILQLKEPDGDVIAQLNDVQKLGFYSPYDGYQPPQGHNLKAVFVSLLLLKHELRHFNCDKNVNNSWQIPCKCS